MSPKERYEGLYESGQLKKLRELATQTGFSQNEILRQALDFFYLHKENMPGGKEWKAKTQISEAEKPSGAL